MNEIPERLPEYQELMNRIKAKKKELKTIKIQTKVDKGGTTTTQTTLNYR